MASVTGERPRYGEERGTFDMPGSNSYRHILPEIHRSRVSQTYLMADGQTVTAPPDGPVTFPETCPACGAARTAETRTGFGSAQYACGAAYKSKPQIQNHTDKWWGTCPVTKAKGEGTSEHGCA